MVRRGKPISDDLRWAIIRMSEGEGLDLDTISRYTNVSTRQILRILAVWRSTGTIRRELDAPVERRGRKRHLSMDDFLQYAVNDSEGKDRFLDELRLMLEEATGKRCSLSTVWRALQRSGYTMKRVSVRGLCA
ncbi:hypothetical protein BV20DRAFT_958735 [Pilatotrama ljubarskyi]|nr:hypothetical protein BV20DRAFT_958735 [Pilatotrama ljubarskyi]